MKIYHHYRLYRQRAWFVKDNSSDSLAIVFPGGFEADSLIVLSDRYELLLTPIADKRKAAIENQRENLVDDDGLPALLRGLPMQTLSSLVKDVSVSNAARYYDAESIQLVLFPYRSAREISGFADSLMKELGIDPNLVHERLNNR